MEKIIGFMDKLSEVPTQNVEPLIFMSTSAMSDATSLGGSTRKYGADLPALAVEVY
jgi:Asp-tRNA(Asn)/Glu-tRNA(Gln) amidotransferase C subunit